MGCDWENESFSDFEVRFLLDRKRNLYSSPTKLNKIVIPKKNKELLISVNADMTTREYSNLMVELSFTRLVSGLTCYYRMRQHFSRPVPADMLSYGNRDVKPKKRGKVEIARFTISKVDIATFNGVSMQDKVEAPTVTTDIAKPKINTLSDYCGNMYDPLGYSPAYVRCTGSKLQHIGNNNVRTYVTEVPEGGSWCEGDQIVVTTGNVSNLYILIGTKWCKLY